MTTSTTRKARPGRPRKAGGRASVTPWLIGGAIFFVALIGLVVMMNNRQTRIEVTTLDLPETWIAGTTLGDPAAPVTIQVWEDFLCPHCRDWTAQIKPQLVDDYIQSGQVRLEFHHLPLPSFEPGSSLGAQASLCAADQGAFWPYHDLLFGTAHNRGQAGFTFTALGEYANQLGLDRTRFTQCLSNQTHAVTINASRQTASQLGLQSTPSVLINGARIDNPFDYAAMQAQLDGLIGAE
jgi:protein-disulfide isomerase